LRTGTLPDIPQYTGGFTSPFSPVVAGASSIQSIQAGPEMNSAIIEKIRAGEIAMYVFGYLSYEDGFSVFGKKKTGFCFAYNARGRVDVSQFTACKERKYTYAH
jgi:hypothetical protein